MTADIFLYFVDLPEGIDEMVTPCLDGYTVYINARICHERQLKAYRHALRHIREKDFEKSDVQGIEKNAESEI